MEVTTKTSNDATARWSCSECGALVSSVTMGYTVASPDDDDVALVTATRLEPCGHTSPVTMAPIHRED